MKSKKRKRPAKKNDTGRPAYPKACPSGRPTKFSRSFIPRALKYAQKGATNLEIAEFLGISETVFYEYMERHPEFKKAIEEADRIRAAGEVELAFFKKALPHDEVTEIHELRGRGKKAKMRKVGQRIFKSLGDGRAQERILKAFKPEKYSEKLQIPGGVPVTIKVNKKYAGNNGTKK